MIHWMYNVTTKDQDNLQDLLERMQLDLEMVLSACQLRWHGHLKRSDGWTTKHSIPKQIAAMVALEKWSEVIPFDCLGQSLRPTLQITEFGSVYEI